MNLADLLSRQAEMRPHETALVLPHKALDFRQLDTLVWNAGALFRRAGISAGDRAALCFNDELGIVIGMLATARIGATAFSLPASWPETLREAMVHRVGIQHLISDHGAVKGVSVRRIDVSLTELDTVSTRSVDLRMHESSPRAPWLILTGSGTTGQPKMMPITHGQQLARCASAREWLGLMATDRVSSMIHFDYSSTKTRFLEALASGASFFIPDRKRQDIPAQCEKAGVTVLHATSFHLEQLMASRLAPGHKSHDFLRILTVRSSTITDEFRKRVAERLCSRLRIHYGTNETGLLTCAQPPLAFDISGTVGQAVAEAEIEIVDPQGNRLSTGQVGRVRARRPGMIDSFLEDDGATRAAFKDGWFYPDDLGKFTPDGQLIYYGRADQMMIMDGINIYPAEIEQAILKHPAVKDAAAIPLPSALHQDIPVCAVTLQPDTVASERDLLHFAYQQLGPHGPRQTVILERIPRNEQGKPIRPQLKQAIENALQQHKARPSARPAGKPVLRPDAFTGLRQPGRMLRLSCQIPLPADLDVLDHWLRSVLQIDVLPCQSLVKPGDALAGQRVSLTWRVLLLFAQLMQAARIPVFAPGCVVAINPDRAEPAAWTATVATAHLDQLPEAAYATAGKEAARLIAWMAARPCTPDNIAELFGMLQAQAVPPLQRLFASGKSTLHVLQAAYACGIPFIHLGAGIFQLGWGCRARKIDRSTTDGDAASGAKLAQNKAWSANLLRRAGLPAPQHGVTANAQEALDIAHRFGWPIVVKPVDRDRGEGVTVGIHDDDRLLAAFKSASKLSKNHQVIVEREVGGVCHRLFIAKGKLLYAVKRLPKSLFGDGQHTVAELIRIANDKEAALPPWRRSEPYPDDPPAQAAMAATGFTREVVPAVGERVPLRDIESTAAGGFDEDVTDRIHPDNLDIALRATVLFDLEIAGIDIITPDIARPWHENGAIINEVNFSPLLGGGEISRRHVPEFLARIIAGDGRIPIEAFIGSETALATARLRHGEWNAQGMACYLACHDRTIGPAGEDIQQPFGNLHQRCTALLLDKRVGAIILVARTAEELANLPVDRLDRITPCGPQLKALRTSPGAIEPAQALPDAHGKDAAAQRLAGVKLKAAGNNAAAIDAFRQSLALEDDIPTRNSLVISLADTGQTEAALIEGLRTLEAKDVAAMKAFAASSYRPQRLSALRRRFDPRAQKRNVIAFSLWGDNPAYVHGAIVNARMAANLYYGWTPRFYCDRSVPADAIHLLRRAGAQVLLIDDPALLAIRPLWRFLAADDPNVDFFLCRDADSRLNGQELNAVDAWLRSGQPFHAMRDHLYHMELLLAGLWGGMTGVLPPLLKPILADPRYRENRFGDQLFLMEFVWPLVRDHILVHDSYYRFHGAEDFPAGYRLPRPIHVGGAIKAMPTWREA